MTRVPSHGTLHLTLVGKNRRKTENTEIKCKVNMSRFDRKRHYTVRQDKGEVQVNTTVTKSGRVVVFFFFFFREVRYAVMLSSSTVVACGDTSWSIFDYDKFFGQFSIGIDVTFQWCGTTFYNFFKSLVLSVKLITIFLQFIKQLETTSDYYMINMILIIDSATT